LESILDAYNVQVGSVGVTQSFQKGTVKVRFVVQVPERLEIGGLYTEIGGVEGVRRISMGQKV
jgi:hypothetical protein